MSWLATHGCLPASSSSSACIAAPGPGRSSLQLGSGMAQGRTSIAKLRSQTRARKLVTNAGSLQAALMPLHASSVHQAIDPPHEGILKRGDYLNAADWHYLIAVQNGLRVHEKTPSHMNFSNSLPRSHRCKLSWIQKATPWGHACPTHLCHSSRRGSCQNPS